MNISSICISTIAILAYLFLFWQALKKKPRDDERLNFSSFLLWSIIDVIMWKNTLRAGTDPTLIGTYTVCTSILTTILLLKKQFKWTGSDTRVAFIAITCLIISCLTSPFIGVVTGALSLFSAGIPNLRKLPKQRPSVALHLMIFLFFLAPFSSLIIELHKNGELKDFVYPATSMFYWVLCFLIHWQYHNKIA